MNILRRSVNFLSHQIVESTLPLVCCTRPIFYSGAPVLYSNVFVRIEEFKLLQRSPFFHLTQRLNLCGMEFNDTSMSELLQHHHPFLRTLYLRQTLVTDVAVENVVLKMSQLRSFLCQESLAVTARSVITLLNHCNRPLVGLEFFFYAFRDEAACRSLILEHDIIHQLFAVLDQRDLGDDTLPIWKASLRLIGDCLKNVELTEIPVDVFAGILKRCEMLVGEKQLRGHCTHLFCTVGSRWAKAREAGTPLEIWEPYFDAVFLQLLPTFLDLLVDNLQRCRTVSVSDDHTLAMLKSLLRFIDNAVSQTRLRDRIEEQCARAGLLDAVEEFMCSLSPDELRPGGPFIQGVNITPVMWNWLSRRCSLQLPVSEALLFLSMRYYPPLVFAALMTMPNRLRTGQRPSDWIPRMRAINKVLNMDGGREMFLKVLDAVTTGRVEETAIQLAAAVMLLLRFINHVTTNMPGITETIAAGQRRARAEAVEGGAAANQQQQQQTSAVDNSNNETDQQAEVDEEQQQQNENALASLQEGELERLCAEAKEHFRVITTDERFVKKRDEFLECDTRSRRRLQQIAKRVLTMF